MVFFCEFFQNGFYSKLMVYVIGLYKNFFIEFIVSVIELQQYNCQSLFFRYYDESFFIYCFVEVLVEYKGEMVMEIQDKLNINF